jgi:hypothetical protein
MMAENFQKLAFYEGNVKNRNTNRKAHLALLEVSKF